MKKTLIRALSFCMILALLTGLMAPFASAIDYEGVEPITLEAAAGLLIDLDTDQVLYEQNADGQRYPASITKIIYHSVAQQMNSEGSNVERNMRYAVHRAWDKCDKAVLARYFGEARAQDKEPPSNREFCAALVEYLRQEACRL